MTAPLDPILHVTGDRHIAARVRPFTMQTRDRIAAFWQEFVAAPPAVPQGVPDALYGVSFDLDGQGGFRYGIGQETMAAADDLPDGLDRLLLPGGPYAVVEKFGPIDEMPQIFDRLFAEWLPGSAFEQRDGPVFERYPSDRRNGPDGMAWEIWMPVTPKTA